MLCLLGSGALLAYHHYSHHYHQQQQSRMTSRKIECNAAQGSSAFSVSTFNLLCPAYRRIMGEPDSVREALYPQSYMKRNRAILDLPMWQSDIICCQVAAL